jgi:hypothetical protein
MPAAVETSLPSPHLVIEIEGGIIAILPRQKHRPGALVPPQQRALHKQRHCLRPVLAVAAAGEQGTPWAGVDSAAGMASKMSSRRSRHGRLRNGSKGLEGTESSFYSSFQPAAVCPTHLNSVFPYP